MDEIASTRDRLTKPFDGTVPTRHGDMTHAVCGFRAFAGADHFIVRVHGAVEENDIGSMNCPANVLCDFGARRQKDE
jgi:hypothetical protein